MEEESPHPYPLDKQGGGGGEEEKQEDADEKDFAEEMMNSATTGGSERRGTFVGTVNYLAPEMVKECESTCETDLWALGCIIFKMATGKVPYPGTAVH